VKRAYKEGHRKKKGRKGMGKDRENKKKQEGNTEGEIEEM
jgi:hypothetical protein